MTQRFIGIALIMVLAYATSGIGQVPEDWRKRYGPPESERYVFRDQILATVFYSAQAQVCKVKINPRTPQSRSVVEEVVNEIIPLNERGKEVRSIGLGGIGGGIESRLYERINISEATIVQGASETIQSATITWIGIQCRYDDQEKHK